MKVNFYRVRIEREDLDFGSLIKQTLQLPDDESRSFEVRGYPIRLQVAHESSDFWSGDMIRIRMNDIPTKASLDGDTEPVSLEDDEGIGEETAFLYHIPSKVLMLQRNKSGVSVSALAIYFREISQLGCPIYLEPILAGDALLRIQKMGVIRKFEIKAAGLDRMDIFKSDDAAVNEILDLRGTYNAPSIHIALSVGNRKDTFLKAKQVINTALALVKLSGHPESQVKTIKISGAVDDDDETEIIDLFEYYLKEEISIQSSRARSLSYQERSNALKDAWVKRVEELSKMFNFEKRGVITSSS
jgi:hypothetical protein